MDEDEDEDEDGDADGEEAARRSIWAAETAAVVVLVAAAGVITAVAVAVADAGGGGGGGRGGGWPIVQCAARLGCMARVPTCKPTKHNQDPETQTDNKWNQKNRLTDGLTACQRAAAVESGLRSTA